MSTVNPVLVAKRHGWKLDDFCPFALESGGHFPLEVIFKEDDQRVGSCNASNEV